MVLSLSMRSFLKTRAVATSHLKILYKSNKNNDLKPDGFWLAGCNSEVRRSRSYVRKNQANRRYCDRHSDHGTRPHFINTPSRRAGSGFGRVGIVASRLYSVLEKSSGDN